MSEAIETTRPTIWFAMEFHGNGDAMFGGSGADWALYETDEGREFMSAADAQRRQLVKAYFTNTKEVATKEEAARKRGGSVSALDVPENPKLSPSSFRWLGGCALVRCLVEEHPTLENIILAARAQGYEIYGFTHADMIAMLKDAGGPISPSIAESLGFITRGA